MKNPIINNFSITFATINGSGSATANNILLKALFRMGIPVGGKNIFPSNIQGMPTWFNIRVNKDGFIGRVEKDNILVAMNPTSFQSDIARLDENGIILHDEKIKLPQIKTEIISYAMPIEKILREGEVAQNLKIFLANMVYVGVLSQLLKIPCELIVDLIAEHFKGRGKAFETNKKIIEIAYSWAEMNIKKNDPYQVEYMKKNQGMVLTNGNTAAALGAIFGGVQFIGWYPITPATGLPESLNEYLPKLRKDEKSGKYTFVSLQAEDELAAIGMVVGAGWAGLRSMTATSGPGLCLMSEYMGLAYLSEVPLVVWDIQRVGPSTGLPTHTSQGDLTFSYFLSHGDTDFIILIPGSVNECFEFGWKALDLADIYQTPVIVLSDLDLGMNDWVTPAFKYPDQPIQKGKLIWENDLEELLKKYNGEWGRYEDIDGDYIPYRTVPGNLNSKAAYFTRGTGHDEKARYSESPEVWERVHQRIRDKVLSSKNKLPKPILVEKKGSDGGFISYGSNDYAVLEAQDTLVRKGQFFDYLRIRAIPFNDEIRSFLESHNEIFIIEANRDGQMAQILMVNFPEYAPKMKSIAHTDGLSLSAEWILHKFELLREKK